MSTNRWAEADHLHTAEVFRTKWLWLVPPGAILIVAGFIWHLLPGILSAVGGTLIYLDPSAGVT